MSSYRVTHNDELRKIWDDIGKDAKFVEEAMLITRGIIQNDDVVVDDEQLASWMDRINKTKDVLRQNIDKLDKYVGIIMLNLIRNKQG
jgi:hypothetical protein